MHSPPSEPDLILLGVCGQSEVICYFGLMTFHPFPSLPTRQHPLSPRSLLVFQKARRPFILGLAARVCTLHLGVRRSRRGPCDNVTRETELIQSSQDAIHGLCPPRPRKLSRKQTGKMWVAGRTKKLNPVSLSGGPGRFLADDYLVCPALPTACNPGNGNRPSNIHTTRY